MPAAPRGAEPGSSDVLARQQHVLRTRTVHHKFLADQACCDIADQSFGHAGTLRGPQSQPVVDIDIVDVDYTRPFNPRG